MGVRAPPRQLCIIGGTCLTKANSWSMIRSSGTLGIGCGPGQRLTVPGTVLPTPRTGELTSVTPSPFPSWGSEPQPSPRRAPLPAPPTGPPQTQLASGQRRPDRRGSRGSSPRGRLMRQHPRPDREGIPASPQGCPRDRTPAHDPVSLSSRPPYNTSPLARSPPTPPGGRFGSGKGEVVTTGRAVDPITTEIIRNFSRPAART